ncbi:MAG: hypothetical protein LC687_05070 [Actinobacteria bacterium]|nr:hypothetical protein [Actinomycetota bacterium]
MKHISGMIGPEVGFFGVRVSGLLAEAEKPNLCVTFVDVLPSDAEEL